MNEQNTPTAAPVVGRVKKLFEDKATYFVIGVGGKAPTRSHRGRYRAYLEAERLARENPGQIFNVVKLKDSVQIAGVPKALAEAFDQLKVLMPVTISPTHHRDAGKQGVIVKLDPETMTAMVNLADDPTLYRYVATSLIPTPMEGTVNG